MADVVSYWADFLGEDSERKVMLSERNEQYGESDRNDGSTRLPRLRGLMGIFGRGRKGEWAYQIKVNDYPTTIGTGSDHLSRDERYGVLSRFDEVYEKAMNDLANTPPYPSDGVVHELLPVNGKGDEAPSVDLRPTVD